MKCQNPKCENEVNVTIDRHGVERSYCITCMHAVDDFLSSLKEYRESNSRLVSGGTLTHNIE